jgi:hypothetical protein
MGSDLSSTCLIHWVFLKHIITNTANSIANYKEFSAQKLTSKYRINTDANNNKMILRKVKQTINWSAKRMKIRYANNKDL